MNRRRAQNGARWSTKWGVAELRMKYRFPKFLGNSGFGEGIRRNKWLFAGVERNVQVNCRHISQSTKFNAKKNKSSKFLVCFTKGRIFADGVGGEIPNRRCICFYFALNPKDLRNLFGIVRFNCGGEAKRMPPFTPDMVMHTHWRGSY